MPIMTAALAFVLEGSVMTDMRRLDVNGSQRTAQPKDFTTFHRRLTRKPIRWELIAVVLILAVAWANAGHILLGAG